MAIPADRHRLLPSIAGCWDRRAMQQEGEAQWNRASASSVPFGLKPFGDGSEHLRLRQVYRVVIQR
jgi:hypothetical protein